MLRALFRRAAPRPLELAPRAAYDLWAAGYAPEAHNPLMAAEQSAVLELLPADLRGRRALDLACGSGRYLRHVTEAGAAGAVGLDLSGRMLTRARQAGYNVGQADMAALPAASGAFDLVVCGLAVGHLAELAPIMNEIARVLKLGGVAVYSDFHPFGHLAGWKRAFRSNEREYTVRHHLHLYSDHLVACQAAGLTIEAVREPVAVDAHGRRAWGDMPVALVIRVARC